VPTWLNAAELPKRLLPCPRGQGVAGSNPAVPTVFERLCPELGRGWALISTPWRNSLPAPESARASSQPN